MGGNVDLDLLSLFPQKYARFIGGIEGGQAFQGQQWWEREGKTCFLGWGTIGEEGPLNRSPKSDRYVQNHTQRYYL